MIEIDDTSTVGAVFFEAATRYGDQLFLAFPANAARAYALRGLEWTYAQTASAVRRLMERYASAGYGLGHRVGLLLENRLEHFLHKLAMNALGVCCVSLNPDHRTQEMAYVIGYAQLDLVVVDGLVPLLQQALALGTHGSALVTLQDADGALPPPSPPSLKRRRLPACFTPRAPPGGPRAACCPTATNWRPGAGMPRVVA